MQINLNDILSLTKLSFESEHVTMEISDWYVDDELENHFMACFHLVSKINNERLLCWSLELYLDFEALYNAYLTIHAKGMPYFESDFTKNQDYMRGFIEQHGFKIAYHLKEFNGNEDNYLEIAKLVDGSENDKGAFGGMMGKKFGI